MALSPARPGVALRAYRGLMRLLAPLLLGWFWWRGRREPAYRANLRQRLGHAELPPSAMGGLWIHAASLGEVQAAQPLIDALLRHWPAHSLTLTTQTPTGIAAARQHWADRIQLRYAPLDTPGATRRFLDALQPQALFLVERELWPQWLWACEQRAIPVLLVNARLSASSAQAYRRWTGVMRHVWRSLRVAAADAPTAQRLQALGVSEDRVSVHGNLKFDRPVGIDTGTRATLPDTPGRRLLVAGSTHEDDERPWLDLWPALQARWPEALLVLVPRHPQRFDAVATELVRRGLPFQRRSQGGAVNTPTGVLLVDAMGELTDWYGRAELCYVGGTLAPVGGHNPLEPMALGRAVLFGPHTFNAATLFDEILQAGAGVCVPDASALRQAVMQALEQPADWRQRGAAAQSLVHRHQGAVAHTLAWMDTALGPVTPQALTPVTTVVHEGETRWLSPHGGQIPNVFAAGQEAAPDTARVATPVATGSGRGTAWLIGTDHNAYVLRHYRRGGAMARLSRDRFWRQPVPQSRAMREFQLLRLMRSWNLPVPEPLAARHCPQGWHYTADIAVGLIPHTENLVQHLRRARPTPQAWAALGQAIRQLHQRQVFHADLNAHNLLLGADGRAWVVDFDKCERRAGHDWKSRNLERLLRSLRKEATRCHPYHWDEADWSLLTQAYHGADRPGPTLSAAPDRPSTP